MAASAFIIPGPAKAGYLNKLFNVTSDTLKCGLLTTTAALAPSTSPSATALSSWTGSTGGLAKWTDISGNEVANGNGYATGGVTLSGVSVFYYASAVSVAATGSGYTAGAQTLTLTGGTSSTAATFSETTSGGGIAAPSVANCGNYSVVPALNAPGTTAFGTSGGGGTGGTLYLTWGMAVTASNPQWTSATFTAKYAAIYDNTDTNKTVLCWCDLEQTQSSGVSVTNGTLTINIAAASGASPGGIYNFV